MLTVAKANDNCIVKPEMAYIDNIKRLHNYETMTFEQDIVRKGRVKTLSYHLLYNNLIYILVRFLYMHDNFLHLIVTRD